MGLALSANILGTGVPTKALSALTLTTPLYNILAVMVLSIYSGNKGSFVDTVIRSLKNLAGNSLIQGLAFGLLVSVLPISLPQFIDTTCEYMGSIASPVALLCIGASLNLSQVKETLKPALYAAVFRLVIVPVLFIPLAIYQGMDREAIAVLFVIYSVPSALSTYPMAKEMGSDGKLASNIIVLTAIGSLFTFTAGVFLLRTLGYV